MPIVALTEVERTTQQLIAELENSLEKVIAQNEVFQQQTLTDANTKLTDTLTDSIRKLEDALENTHARGNAELENTMSKTIAQLNQVLNDDTDGVIAKWDKSMSQQLADLDEKLARQQLVRKGVEEENLERMNAILTSFSTQAEERQAKADVEADDRQARANEAADAREARTQAAATEQGEKLHENATARLEHLQNKIVNPGFDRLEEATNSLSRKFVRAILLLLILAGLMVFSLTMDSTMESFSSNDTARIIVYVVFLLLSLMVMGSRGLLNAILGIKGS